MEKFKTLYGFIEDLKFLENCDEDNNYTKDLLSELELILKEREEMLELLKEVAYFHPDGNPINLINKVREYLSN